jgi:predicted chitinase
VATAADFIAEQLFHVAASTNAGALSHISRLLQACSAQGITDPSQVAYVLASAHHESGMGAFMVEFASGDAYEGRADLGNSHPGDGRRYKGRGYVQITGRRNYTLYTGLLGVDLVTNPELATDPGTASRIVADGMANGRFTGHNLAAFGTDGSYDFENARQIVNGHDRAAHIAGIARRYRTAMNPP